MKKELLSRAREFAKKYKYLLIVLAAGILLLLLPTGSSDGGAAEAQPEPSFESFELAAFERQLAEALERMDGVGETEVVLTLRSTMETIYQTDTRSSERDGSLEQESDTVVVSVGSGVQTAVVSSRNYPEFQGALIVCDGGASAAVRLEVTRAVAALTGLSSDRITVSRRQAE